MPDNRRSAARGRADRAGCPAPAGRTRRPPASPPRRRNRQRGHGAGSAARRAGGDGRRLSVTGVLRSTFMLKQAIASYPADARCRDAPQSHPRGLTRNAARYIPPASRPRPPAGAEGPCGGTGRRARLKIEFRKECWFDSGQGHQAENTNENNSLSHWFDSIFLGKFSSLVENTGKKLAQLRPICWHFCWHREIKTIAANFAIRRAPNEVGLRNQRMDRETRIGTRRSIKSKYLFSSALVFTILPPASCSQ